MASTPPLITKVSAILLAGGRSRRMGGVTKALLTLSGQTIIERVAQVLVGVFREVIVITNTPPDFAFLGLPMLPDIQPGCGSLGGLYTGLTACSGHHAFLVACDMPFLHQGVIRYIAGHAGEPDVVVPRVGYHLEPLHAMYSRACVSRIRSVLNSGDLKIINFFNKVSVLEVPDAELRRIDPSLDCFMNINTPEDLETAQAMLDHARVNADTEHGKLLNDTKGKKKTVIPA